MNTQRRIKLLGQVSVVCCQEMLVPDVNLSVISRTSILIQMLQSDWLSYRTLSAISLGIRVLPIDSRYVMLIINKHSGCLLAKRVL